MRPVYIYFIFICLLTCCDAKWICVPIRMMSSTCRRKWINDKRGGGHMKNYRDYPQDDEKRAMLQLRDETRKFIAMLLKEVKQEKTESGGSNQNVYGLRSYDYDFQRYF